MAREKHIGVGAATTHASGVAVGPGGDVYVTGHTNGDLAGTHVGTQDGYVRAYNMGGDYRWTSHIGATGQASQANSVAVDSGANVDVVGSTDGTLTDCLAADCTHQGAAGLADGFARKLSRGGAVLWTRQNALSTTAADHANGVAVRATTLYVGGDTRDDLSGAVTGLQDGYLAKIVA